MLKDSPAIADIAEAIENDPEIVATLNTIARTEQVKTLVSHHPETGAAIYRPGYVVDSSGNYHFADENGQHNKVPASRVRPPKAKTEK